MAKIALVTDSTSDLSKEALEVNNIHMISLQVRFEGKDYKDRVDISTEEFLDRLEDVEEFPSTSQPPLGGFVELYKSLAKEYDHIVSIHISDKLSGTYKAAKMAANMLGDVDIRVIDSKTTSAPLGVIVLEAAKFINHGNSIDEVVELVEKVKDNVNIYFVIDELTYLEKGGRIGKAAAFMGNLLKLKPMLTIEDGEIIPYKRIRGEKKVYKTFIELSKKELDGKVGRKLVILYGKYKDKANILKEHLVNEFEWEEVEMIQLGAVVASHTGPTPFGMIIYK